MAIFQPLNVKLMIFEPCAYSSSKVKKNYVRQLDCVVPIINTYPLKFGKPVVNILETTAGKGKGVPLAYKNKAVVTYVGCCRREWALPGTVPRPLRRFSPEKLSPPEHLH